MTARSIVGTISGTSADGIDLAGLLTDGRTVSRFGPSETAAYRPETKRRVLAAAANKGTGREDWPAIAEAVTQDHADAIAAFLEKHGLKPEAVVFHGQTVWHDPKAGETVQLGDPQGLADALVLPVVGDVRLADMAAGGEGAPLVPVYHRALAKTLVGEDREPLCFLNIGGVSNLTYIDGDNLMAFDIGPGNAFLDDWVRRHGAGDFDAGGAIAARGKVDEVWLGEALRHPFLTQPGPKSLDRYSFSAGFAEGLGLEDGAATLLAFTARAIATSEALLPKVPKLWLVCGGGRLNPVLMEALDACLSGQVVSADAYRIDGDALEAQAMAFLGARLMEGLPTTFPETTGASRPVVGGKLYLPNDCAPMPT
ncbi:anhydro-N-acetylmuramic acid kinase [Roseibium aggregatum]|uniref:Anhydro-N-acetylmuramic acid kinase n=1 Tax=Roseibium aggregatum TaxID=187304 RepID=A0A939E981_9HYPH|nr:anhydro-N-acetylmuramic acid kinase [Roseibium aggregatum]MBN9668915.1 anhydro-N-acetylmuramic acid kinase [Roseibium aggregatum]